jgi:hypothetical protein
MTEVKVPDAGGATVTMVDIGGFAVGSFFKQAHEIKQIVDDTRNFTFRDEDIMLCTFGKTGLILLKFIFKNNVTTFYKSFHDRCTV